MTGEGTVLRKEITMKLDWKETSLTWMLLVCLATGAGSAPQYTMTLLGFSPISPTSTGTNGIKVNGDVVGYDSAINGAFLDHSGKMTSLHVPPGVGVAINTSGHVAIRSWGPDLHAYVYSPPQPPFFPNRLRDIGTLGGTGGLNNSGESVALDMNDYGTVVGLSTISGTSTQTWHAFSWTAGQMTDLGVLPQGDTVRQMQLTASERSLGTA